MPAIRIHESALCCDTGVCGPDVDQSLVQVAGLGESPVEPQSRPELGLREKSGGCCGGSTSCC